MDVEEEDDEYSIRVLVRDMVPATPRRSVHPGSSLTYRASHTNHTRLADKRQAEAQRIRTKYPERIPVRHPQDFIQTARGSSRAVRGGFCVGKTRGLF